MKLKDVLRDGHKNQKDDETEEEDGANLEANEDGKPTKRKHMKERSGKYMKRVKQTN